jgi:hypothetical protein
MSRLRTSKVRISEPSGTPGKVQGIKTAPSFLGADLQVLNNVDIEKRETPVMVAPVRRRLTNGMIWNTGKLPDQPDNAFKHWKGIDMVPQVVVAGRDYDPFSVVAPNVDPYSKDYFELHAVSAAQDRMAALADKSETGVFNYIEAIEESSRRGSELLKIYQRDQFNDKVAKLKREGFSDDEVKDYLKKHRMETMEQLVDEVESRPKMAETLGNAMGPSYGMDFTSPLGKISKLPHSDLKGIHAVVNAELQIRNAERKKAHEMRTTPLKDAPARKKRLDSVLVGTAYDAENAEVNLPGEGGALGPIQRRLFKPVRPE